MMNAMEQPPLPDFDAMDAMKQRAEAERRKRLLQRLGEFLSREAGTDANHPAEVARVALEAGSTAEVVAYLSHEIDKAAADQDEARRGELMRWKTSFSSGN